jgi:hypothetical protein
MSSKIVLSVADLRADTSVTDVKSVIAATLLSADFVLDPDSKHQWFYDSFVFADAPSFGLGKNPDDAVTVDDAISQIAFGLGKSDTVTMSESINVLLELLRAFSDSVGFTDSPVNAVSIAPTDQYQLTEADAKGVALGKSDSYGFNDNRVSDVGKNLTDSQAMSDVFARTVVYARNFSDAFSLDDAATINAFIKDTSNAKTNVFGFADAQAFGFDKSASDSLSLSDAIDSFVFAKGVTDTVSVTENFSFALFTNAAMNAATLNSAPFNQ